MDQLIGAVRRYPCLWNSAAIEYRDQELKDAAWAEVMKETNLSSVKEVKLKWKKLRDSYRDALKRQSEVQAREGPAGAGAAAGSKRGYPWKYMALMQFLQPHMSNRKKESPPPPAARSSDSDSEASAPKRPRAAPSPPAPAAPAAPSPSAAALHRKLDYLCQQLGAGGAAPADPLDAFFTGMCQSAKRLPFAAQLKIKKAVFLAVTQAEEELLSQQAGYAALAAGAPWPSDTSSDAPTDDKGS